MLIRFWFCICFIVFFWLKFCHLFADCVCVCVCMCVCVCVSVSVSVSVFVSVSVSALFAWRSRLGGGGLECWRFANRMNSVG